MSDCKHYRPGDPGFEELAGKVTPLHKIRKGFSQQRNGITAEVAPPPKIHRTSNINELRG